MRAAHKKHIQWRRPRRAARFTRVLLELFAVVAVGCILLAPAEAQRYRGEGGGFFQQLFGPFRPGPSYEQQQPAADYSRAPAAKKPDPNAVPTTTILVMGDGMADWLGYGLEDALSDTPEIAVVRKNKQHSGLIRYDAKGDMDWSHAARDILGQEKADYIVMMIGVSDRQNIRERDLDKDAGKKDEKKKGKDEKAGKNNDEADAKNKDEQGKSADEKADAESPDQSAIAAPEPQGKRNGVIEFRSDQWAEIYSKRIDETIAALKSKGVPVFWVGLPAIRGTKSTADTVYLNDLFRARAERAGITYVDVWDGFVDEQGKFTTFGPDYEGQTRRLRSGDGVYFTKAGALKLAHYIERELRRVMANRAVPVSLPSGPITPQTPSSPAVRPLAGPVVPLTVTPDNSNDLLGGANMQPSHGDPIANQVLVKGEAVPPETGRADDFAWPRGSDAKASAPVTPTASAEPAAKAAVEKPAKDTKTKPAPKNAQKGKGKQAAVEEEKQKPKPAAKRAPQKRTIDPFGWLR